MQGSPERSKFAWRPDRKQHRENYARSQQMSKNPDGVMLFCSAALLRFALTLHQGEKQL